MSVAAHIVNKIDMSLSDRCNLNCSFCYTHGGCGNSYNQEHIDKMFNWLFEQFLANANEQHRKTGIYINVFGGEPLVEWEHFKKMVLSKGEEARQKNIKINFAIVTNMTLLDEEKLNWCISHKIGISPSIDGCQPAQDAERKYADGSGSSSVVYENARRLVARRSNRTVRMTISPKNVDHLFDSIVFLANDIGFTTVNAVLAGGVEWTDEKLEIHKQQIEKVTDWWIDEMRHGKHVSLYHLRNMFMGIWSGRRIEVLCSAGGSQVGIDTEGNIYPCHRFCNLNTKSEYLLGTLDTGITNTDLVEKLLHYNIAKANEERCKNCPAVLGCHALCIHEMMIADKGMFEPVEHYCKVWPFYWKMAMKAHGIMMAENNKLYLQHYDPKNRPSYKSYRGSSDRNMQPTVIEKPGEIVDLDVFSIKIDQQKNGDFLFTAFYRVLFQNGLNYSIDKIVCSQSALRLLYGHIGDDFECLIKGLKVLFSGESKMFLRITESSETFKVEKKYLKKPVRTKICDPVEICDLGLNLKDLNETMKNLVKSLDVTEV